MSENYFSLEESFRKTEKFVRRRAFKFWFVTQIMIRPEARRFTYLVYTYLRWADDFVDTPGELPEVKVKFIERQLKLFDKLKEGEEDGLPFEEMLLAHYMKYLRTLNSPGIIEGIRSILESIQLDAQRLQSKKVFTKEELDIYIDKQTRPLYNLIYYLLYPQASLPVNNPYAGKFLWFVLVLRDFQEDCNAGFINISCEEVDKYGLNIRQLKIDNNLTQWKMDKFPEIIKILNEDAALLNSSPVKIKFFWWAAFPALITELVRMRIYNFSESKKTLLKEIKILLLSSKLSILTIMKIFIFKGIEIKP